MLKSILSILLLTVACIGAGAQCTTEEIVKKYAPELRLYTTDKYRPSSIDWYLARTGLIQNDRLVYERGELDRSNLAGDATDSIRPYGAGWATRELNHAIIEEVLIRKGNISTTTAYVNVGYSRLNPEDLYIQYWFFYPYNEGRTIFSLGKHQGDWEHVTIQIDGDCGLMKKMYFSSHGDQGKWYQPWELEYTLSGHPIVYSAKDSHGNFPTPGIHPRGAGLPDERTDKGPAVRTWERFEIVRDETENPGFEIQSNWINYGGEWGTADSPNAQKKIWLGKDENIDFFLHNLDPANPYLNPGDKVMEMDDWWESEEDLSGGTYSKTSYIYNDRIRSMKIFGAKQGTLITVFDHFNGITKSSHGNQAWNDHGDDYTEILVKQHISSVQGIMVSSFEQSFENDFIKVTYHGKNGLDGKVSLIKVLPGLPGQPPLVTGSSVICNGTTEKYTMRRFNGKGSWKFSSVLTGKVGKDNKVIEITANTSYVGPAFLSYIDAKKRVIYKRDLWIGKPRHSGVIGGPQSVSAGSPVTYQINGSGKNNGHLKWEAPCLIDLFTMEKTCWQDLSGKDNYNSFTAGSFSGQVRAKTVNECGAGPISSFNATVTSGTGGSFGFAAKQVASNDPLLDKFDAEIYPNPVNLNLEINVKDVEGGVRVTLVDLKGIVVLTEHFMQNQMSIPVDHLAEGLYVLRLETNQGVISRNIQVIH